MNETQERLVVENQRLVYFVANRLRHRAVAAGVEFDDLVATGMLGLCKAARVYDPSRAKFSVLAVRCIENEMRLLLRQGRRRPKTTSLDDGPHEDDESKVGHLESAWLRCEADFSEVEWREFAGRLSDRERSVLALAWLGYTQKDIAKRVGISRTHVSRVLGRIERRWNHQIQAGGE